MTFKDNLDTDLDIFFNADEFAVDVVYNGTEITLIPDTEITASTSVPGVVLPSLTAYIRDNQISSCKQGDRVVIDDITYYVGPSPVLDGGVWMVTLDREVKSFHVGV